MPQPFNYAIDLPDPTSNIMKTLQIGSAIQAQQARQTAAAKADEQQKALQADLASLGTNPTPAAVANLSAKYPTLSEKFQKTYDMLESEQQKAHVDTASQVYASLLSGNTEVAQDVLQQRIEAAENSGNEKEAKTMETMLKLINLNPETAKMSAGVFLSHAMGKDKFVDTFSKLEETRRATALQPGALKKQGVDLGLTEAQTNKVLVENKKLDAEAQQAILELEAMKRGDIIDPEKKFNQEEKLRKEYNTRTKGYLESKDAFTKIKESAKAKTGAGDIALITSFMKMLDPGSVVRDSEFATARDTAGLYGRLKNAAASLESGRLFELDSPQRDQYVALAKKYMAAAEKQEGTVKKSLQKVVDNYKLNPENVFAEKVEEFGEEPTDENEVTIGDQTFTRPEGFTDEQWDAYKQSQGVQ